jgi:methenyltetrahydrofolate cyclohydrolase
MARAYNRRVLEEPERSRYRDLTLAEFVERLASADPVPGGGSASAVAAALGASLVSMVAALSEGRPKYAAHAATHIRTSAEGRRLVDRFLALADQDATAYAAFAAALKLPRDSEAERAARTVALQSAARTAAEVPLACVGACRDLVAAAEALAGRSNANASSDLAVAAHLGEAAARGAAANVLVNLPSIGDEAVAVTLRGRVDELLGEIKTLADTTLDVVSSGATRDEPVAVG